MKEEIKLPALGENIDSGDVAKIRVEEGSDVEKDTVLLELETEKALLEIPCPVAGKVTGIKVSEGDTVKVGQVLFEVDTDSQGAAPEAKEKEEKEGEEPEKAEKKEPSEEKKEPARTEAPPQQKEETPKKEKEEKPKQEEPAAEKEAKETAEEEEGTKPEAESVPVPAGPGARRLARELGVDLKQVNGTARGGRITLDDVKAYTKQKLSAPSSAGPSVQPIELPDFSQWGEVETEKLKSLRTKIADNMIRAWNAVPLVTQFDEADITELDALRKKEAGFVEKKGGKLTITVLVLKALAGALKAHRQFNASVDLNEGVIHYKKYYNIGVAVDTPAGLIVPVIKNVDCKSVVELAVELAELSERARNRKVSLEELRGGNISISNLGGIGGTAFTPLVVPPEVAVVGLARGRMQPVWKDCEFQPRLILPFCVSYDHKVIDGADAARFARTLAEELENYTEMLLSS